MAVVFDASLSACLNDTNSGVACMDPGVSPALQRPLGSWHGTVTALGMSCGAVRKEQHCPPCLQGWGTAGGQALFAG